MRRVRSIIGLFALTSLTACGALIGEPASDTIEQRTYTLDQAPTALAISHGAEVIVDNTLTQGEVHILAHSNILEALELEAKSATLNIGLDKRIKDIKTFEVRVPEYMFNSVAISGGAEFTWHTADIEQLSIASSGGAEVDIAGRCNELCIASSGGSDVSIEGLIATNVTVAVSGGSDIDIEGRCERLNVAASAGSDADFEELIAENVTAEASSGADVSVFATKSLTAKASSGASITYGGNPTTLELEESSGGEVIAER